MKNCSSENILFPTCQETCLLSEDPNKCQTIMIVIVFYKESVNCDAKMIIATDQDSFKTVIYVKIIAVWLILLH